MTVYFIHPHINQPSTTDQNRDIHIQPPPNYPNLFPQNHFLTQTNLLPSDYRFHIPHDNFTHDPIIGKVSKMTSYYNHWFPLTINFHTFNLISQTY